MTDKLSVKWYLLFDPCEVKETVEMGGELLMQYVDWKIVQEDLYDLLEMKPKRSEKCFEGKWAPEIVARYILDTVRKN